MQNPDNIDEESFTTILPFVKKLARNYRGIDPEDLTQEVIVRLLKSPPVNGNLKHFLRVVVRNTAMSMFREQKSQRRGGSYNLVSIDALEGPHHLPSYKWEEPIYAEVFNKAFEDLSQAMQQTLLLSIEGFSVQEIAEITGTSTKGIYTRLCRARQHVRHALRTQGYPI